MTDVSKSSSKSSAWKSFDMKELAIVLSEFDKAERGNQIQSAPLFYVIRDVTRFAMKPSEAAEYYHKTGGGTSFDIMKTVQK